MPSPPPFHGHIGGQESYDAQSDGTAQDGLPRCRDAAVERGLADAWLHALRSPKREKRPMWLHNCWQVIGFSREIGNVPLARTVCGEEIVLFRTQSGKAAALADRCPHRFAPLSLGRVTGEQIQ